MHDTMELLLLVVGILCAVLFSVCCCCALVCRTDVNLQEKRFNWSEDEKVAYMGEDDRLHAGVVNLRTNRERWTLWSWIRGHVLVETLSVPTQYMWIPAQNVMRVQDIFQPREHHNLFTRHRSPSDLEDGTAPWIGNFMRAYTPIWSFIINNVIIALSTAFGFEVRFSSDVDAVQGFFVIFGITFLSGLVIMTCFYILFGFGEAMCAPRRPRVLSNELAHSLFRGLKLQPGEALIVTETNQIYGPRLRFNYVSKIFLEPTKSI